MKVLMIINLKSGMRNSKNSLLDAIEVFSNNGYEVVTYMTKGKNDAYDYLVNCKKKYDLICVAGGDGTLNEVTNALMRKKNKPLLGYFPSGTMNDFASNFNLDNNFKEIAQKICIGKIHEFDVGKLNNRYFNYVFAFGNMCDIPYTTDRGSKEALGSIAYFIEGVSKLSEIKRNHIKYTINNKTYESDILFGFIYSGNRVAGIQLESKSKARVDDGLFNVVIVDYVPSIIEVPDLLTTLINNKEHIHRFTTDKIILESQDDLICTLDGEEAKVKNKVEIKLINKALKLLA